MEIRITPASEYDRGDGFIIEERRYWQHGRGEKCWAIPAWDEMGLAELDGVFPTLKAARFAVRDAGLQSN